ncbi:MAG: sporulation integral rane protein YlbJ, partial [Peptococcaceae bacterium]|nr:sporulation integral rane protein YlbJ [Peptococcaceae bacterium]
MLTLLLKIKRNILSLLYALGAVVLVSAMMIWPQQTYEGARFGLNIWLTILVPSLFPFFIIAEILLNLGVVNFLGVLLEPVMRPLFNLPGTASFVIAMGFTSGFPMGAVMTKRLCEEKCCTLAEGERLVAFTNNSSPLFILVAVAVGMFNNPGLGLVLAVSHYTANII